MRKFILFFSLAVLTVAFFAFKDGGETTKKVFEFPEYVETLNLENSSFFDCSANCAGYSCSGSGACVCSCDDFSCRCESNNGTLDPGGIGVSINAEQYKKTRALAQVLFNLEDENAKQAYIHLSGLVKELKNKNHEAFHKERDLYKVALHDIKSELAKEKVNSFFKKEGFQERI